MSALMALLWFLAARLIGVLLFMTNQTLRQRLGIDACPAGALAFDELGVEWERTEPQQPRALDDHWEGEEWREIPDERWASEWVYDAFGMRDTHFLLPDCWWPGRDVYMPGTNASVVLSQAKSLYDLCDFMAHLCCSYKDRKAWLIRIKSHAGTIARDLRSSQSGVGPSDLWAAMALYVGLSATAMSAVNASGVARAPWHGVYPKRAAKHWLSLAGMDNRHITVFLVLFCDEQLPRRDRFPVQRVKVQRRTVSRQISDRVARWEPLPARELRAAVDLAREMTRPGHGHTFRTWPYRWAHQAWLAHLGQPPRVYEAAPSAPWPGEGLGDGGLPRPLAHALAWAGERTDDVVLGHVLRWVEALEHSKWRVPQHLLAALDTSLPSPRSHYVALSEGAGEADPVMEMLPPLPPQQQPALRAREVWRREMATRIRDGGGDEALGPPSGHKAASPS